MPTQIRVVNNRTFLLGLDDLYRARMKEHERGELLQCAQVLCDALRVQPQDGPVEGYYPEDDLLTEYFQRMRALQEIEGTARSMVEHLAEFQRLFEITSAPLFGEPTSLETLLPKGKDSLSKALEATFPAWTIQALTDAAYAQASQSDDFSLVGLAALAKEPVVIAALRETAVLYAEAAAGAAFEPVTAVYKWAVDPVLEERATRFVSLFNTMFNEELPFPDPANAEQYWNAADAAHVYGRCVRLGYDDSVVPIVTTTGL